MTRISLSLMLFAFAAPVVIGQPVGPPRIEVVEWRANQTTPVNFDVIGKRVRTSSVTGSVRVQLFREGNPPILITSGLAEKRRLGSQVWEDTFRLRTSINQLPVGSRCYVVIDGQESGRVTISACGTRRKGLGFAPPGAMAPELYASASAVSGQVLPLQTTGSDYVAMPGDLYASLPTEQTSFLATGASVYLDLTSAFVVSSFMTDVNGAMQLPIQVPPSLPQGLTVTVQAIVFDPVAPLLFHATTNGLDVTIL